VREEIANLVYPVIDHTLRLKEQLERGEPGLDLDNEQAALKGLLGTEAASRRWAEFGGDGGLDSSLGGTMRGMSDHNRRSGGDGFLGIRFVLACWVDEIMIDSPWEEEWKEKKLETALYGTADRAFRFWEQARKAETRQGSDALEVFFLCVMLGFRGDYRDQPDKLRAWANNVQTRIAQGQGKEWPAPDGQDPTTNVPPLRGREKLKRLVMSWSICLLVAVFVGVFFVIHKLAG
jgi:type VI secretion system protein ImpK